jgi:hypothetical protein
VTETTVPGITEDELRLEAVRAVPRKGNLPLGPTEFAASDWAQAHGISRSMAERELAALVADGALECVGARLDARTGRQVKGYRRRET